VTPDEVQDVIIDAVIQIGRERGVDVSHVDDQTRLLGSGALLDSVGLVTVVMEIEARLEEELGLTVSLTSDAAMSQERSPLRSVASLRDFVLVQASAGSHG